MLDLCSGNGSSAVACLTAGHNVTIIEVDERQVRGISQRLQVLVITENDQVSVYGGVNIVEGTITAQVTPLAEEPTGSLASNTNAGDNDNTNSGDVAASQPPSIPSPPPVLKEYCIVCNELADKTVGEESEERVFDCEVCKGAVHVCCAEEDPDNPEVAVTCPECFPKWVETHNSE